MLRRKVEPQSMFAIDETKSLLQFNWLFANAPLKAAVTNSVDQRATQIDMK